MLYIVGLGPGDIGLISQKGWALLTRPGLEVILRTGKHPVAFELEGQGFAFRTYDGLYESHSDFAHVYEAIVADIWRRSEREDIVYAVPGSPMVAESTVQQLLDLGRQHGRQIEVVLAPSSLEAVMLELGLDPVKGLAFGDALDQSLRINPSYAWLITQVHSRLVAGDLKLRLLDIYPPEHAIAVVRHAGSSQSFTRTCELAELDRAEFTHADTVYIPPCPEARHVGVAMENLVEVMTTLRDACPWDREQTHLSLRPHLIEEAYEVLSAIEGHDAVELAEELGDLLLQVVFHAQIAREAGEFELYDSITGITAKLKRRHPHVFGQVKATTSSQVEENWRRIKQVEKAGHNEGWLDSVPLSLPSLLLAYKLQVRAKQVGFDWPAISGAWQKVDEEIRELQLAVEDGEASGIEQEFGDVLFSLVNVGRFLKVEPETALRAAAHKFKKRFSRLEQLAASRGLVMAECTLQELDSLWDEAKAKEK